MPVGDARRKLEGAPLNRILHVSSMHDGQKNISGLLEALDSICVRTLCARHPGGRRAGLDTYQAWIDDRGLADRIHLTGPLDGDGVVKAMQSHDVLVLNSRSENFPCVIAEAWACSIPASTDVGGIHEHLPTASATEDFCFPRKRTPPRGPRPSPSQEHRLGPRRHPRLRLHPFQRGGRGPSLRRGLPPAFATMTSPRIFPLSCLTVAWMAGGTLWAQGYTVYNTGASADGMFDAQGICLMGGASENDEGMAWFLERAGGGDVLVLRASGSDGYNSYFNDLGVNLHRVTTVVCQNANASSAEEVLDLVHGAEAIWFAGGDQAAYHPLGQGTPLHDAINHALAPRNIAIGGTSAGMAILGGLRFTADNGTVYSDEALDDPYNSYMTLDQSPFLDVPLLATPSPTPTSTIRSAKAGCWPSWRGHPRIGDRRHCDCMRRIHRRVHRPKRRGARVWRVAAVRGQRLHPDVQCDLDNPAPEVCAPGQP